MSDYKEDEILDPTEDVVQGYEDPMVCMNEKCILTRRHREKGEKDCVIKEEISTFFDEPEDRYQLPSGRFAGSESDTPKSWEDWRTKKYSSPSNYTAPTYEKCRHEPTACFKVKDTDVTYYGGSKEKVDEYEFDGLVVCLLGETSQFSPKEVDVYGTGDWAKMLKPHMHRPKRLKNFISIDWSDMSAPPVEHGFFKALHKRVLEKKIKNVLFYCYGGHGRTGTALASVLIEVCGLNAAQAMKWVHKNYCKEAIESESQRGWLKEISPTE